MNPRCNGSTWLCGKCRKLYPASAAAIDQRKRESRGGGGRGRGGRMRDIALETGAAAIAVTGSLTGAGTPPTVDQLDDSQQITHSQKRDSIGDASNQRRRR